MPERRKGIGLQVWILGTIVTVTLWMKLEVRTS